MSPEQQTAIDAATFQRLLQHLDDNKDVQNIELMILADFCRNCLAKWMVEAAAKENLELDYEQARERVYGMPYSEWKEKFQTKATEQQLAALEARTRAKRNAT
ncbi:MAG: DUF1244 domain-containing protein [Gammaproteobacteria bacterium]|nr:DUF1244 domain-containing protein [Oceanospirillaceae bacterium]NVK87894.1 DUF1244 domain-containing protein [Gammaproteobacteria bacterium]